MISRFFISKRPPQQPGEKFIGLVKKKFKKPRFAETSAYFTPMETLMQTMETLMQTMETLMQTMEPLMQTNFFYLTAQTIYI
tara:strand:- start:465 stop:710 length:246 start_codon:yes stop_codon:yes gene_type:complete